MTYSTSLEVADEAIKVILQGDFVKEELSCGSDEACLILIIELLLELVKVRPHFHGWDWIIIS
jgi:hypothetical protein